MGSLLSPFLNKLGYLADTQSFGSVPVSKDFSNIVLTTGAISLLSSFSRTGLISSGPAALSGFKFAKSLRAPFKSISISGI